ncbi:MULTISPECIES: hypothetical protein [Cyanophyceae]|uniref:hypothetical protein n=1 Tax=Cyanophyceae TaxID=3028117 RepID=UPI0016824036|nr:MULTISPECIES: hypothetical protein [Cyanophyceae]MBD1915095.1 hypothetical protein [Phormidium sp. FACHB-77]MBD2029762.1 hypothetical protein [Phormidium sp. FACHB-322]MBD2050455.1 hypothetical protein [Leptolyngbya sp. FACHB-60]
MADDRDPIIRLQLDLSPDQPGLLEGLDTWLRLGLITDQQVRDLGRANLSCDWLPATVPKLDLADAVNPFLEPEGAPAAGEMPTTDAVPAGDAPITDFVPVEPAVRPRRQRSPRFRNIRPSTPRQTRGTAQPSAPTNLWLGRLMSELSVVWLLGLGVFLVVLSSAVLAATQWARFNAVGQYLVLLAYTLVFWAAGLWCHRRPNLQLTAKTLQMITLLLVPLNFWALDGLGVWRGGGVLVGAIAAILLTFAALQVLRQQNSTPLEQANALGLAYLHTGWGLSGEWGGVPLLAVYAGVLGTAAATVYGQRQQPAALGLRWPTVVITAALGLLLARGLSPGESIQAGQFGLAFGLYGATLVWLGQRRLALKPEVEPTAEANSQLGIATDRPFRGGIALGRGLLWWGWLLAIADWLIQALGIGLLGLALRIQALGKLGKRRDLLIAYAIAVQLGFVGWEMLPLSLRQPLLVPLAKLDEFAAGTWPLLGISLFPYVVGMVALADWYRRRDKLKLSHFSDGIALGSNLVLTLISLASGPVLVVNLIASTITALVVTLRRFSPAQWRIVVTYGLALGSIVVAIGDRWPNLPLAHWVVVMVALATVALVLSKGLRDLWGRTAWLYGIGLSTLSYALLWADLVDSGWRASTSWVGLVIPLVLMLIGRHRASVLTTGIALPFTLGLPWTRLVGLGSTTALTGVNSTFYRRPGVAFLAVGFATGWVYSSLADWITGFPRHLADWGLVTVGLTAALWLAWRLLPMHQDAETPSLSGLYRVACDRWGHILAIGLLTLSTFAVSFYYLGWREPRPLIIAVLAAFLASLVLRYWGTVRPLTIYLAGWGIELLVAGIVIERYPAVVSLAVPTLGLGAIALALAAIVGRSRPALVPPLQTLTLLYAGLALALRAYTATAWTGWLVVVAALLVLEVGRRSQTALARWLALGLLSVGWYELVIYQMLQGSGGEAADALLVLAGVAALIMTLYRLAAGQLDRTLGIPQVELVWAAHLHWFIGSLLMLGGGIGFEFVEATLWWLGLAIATALVLYALSQGRLGASSAVKTAWVYAGLGELVGWFALGRSLFPTLGFLDNWWGVVACAVAVPVYWLPWATWGWPQRPWRVMAVVLPLLITLLTGGFDHIPTLWVLTGFYGWLAWHSGKIRLSYLSVLCAAWAIWVWLETRSIDDSLAWVLPLGLALLYIAQVDPALKRPGGKEQRHWLRLIALAMILLTALLTERWAGLPVGAMALGAIAAGLLLRIRALLYAGTVVFALNALNQLVVLNAAFPFIKWVVGILVGVALIWIAADVERRRGQWLQLTQSWGQDLDAWQ